MATFLLVPGALHPAWCWHRIVPLLTAAGHAAIALDMPGTAENRSIHPRDATLAIWADYVADQIRAAKGPVLLAGHSRGGHVIGEAAERVPELLAGLIYVTAIISPPGKTLLETTGYDRSMVPPLDVDGCMEVFPADVATERFYHRCSPEDAKAIHARLFPEPYGPDSSPATVTFGRWGRVPRAYVECSDDRTISLELQRAMQAAAPCDPVFTIDADHSPFFSAPNALADAMLATAERFAPEND